MKELTKEKLTKEQIQKQLKRRLIRLTVLYSIYFASIILPMGLLMFFAIKNMHTNTVIGALYAIGVIFTYISIFDRMREIDRGEFFVVRDKVVRVAREEKVSPRRFFYRSFVRRLESTIENNIYFDKYGKYTVSTGVLNGESVTSVMDYTDVGDEFLIVIFRSNPVKYFNAKLYEYVG